MWLKRIKNSHDLRKVTTLANLVIFCLFANKILFKCHVTILMSAKFSETNFGFCIEEKISMIPKMLIFFVLGQTFVATFSF